MIDSLIDSPTFIFFFSFIYLFIFVLSSFFHPSKTHLSIHFFPSLLAQIIEPLCLANPILMFHSFIHSWFPPLKLTFFDQIFRPSKNPSFSFDNFCSFFHWIMMGSMFSIISMRIHLHSPFYLCIFCYWLCSERAQPQTPPRGILKLPSFPSLSPFFYSKPKSKAIETKVTIFSLSFTKIKPNSFNP